MNILVLEDEYAARKNLVAILKEISPENNIIATLESVSEAKKWIAKNPPPHLGFFDIQLSDDNVFKLFSKVKLNFPIIFTTAYDQYALRAFSVNSIDYLLKPVSTSAVKKALHKYDEMLNIGQDIRNYRILNMLSELKHAQTREYRKTFLVQFKDKLIPLSADEIMYFYIENGIVYAMKTDKKNYSINQNLDDIKEQLDPDQYFRANRQYIISRHSVKEISPYFNERLSLRLQPPAKETVIVSKSKVGEFKSWLTNKNPA
jgi:two-component system LytT family response regulator